MSTENSLPARRPSRARRDQQIRRAVSRLRTFVPALDRPEYLPLLRSYARITLLIERSYELLRDGSLVDENGELRASLDTIRRLMSTQAALGRELGLSPSAARSVIRQPKDLAAAFAEAEDGEVVEEDGDRSTE